MRRSVNSQGRNAGRGKYEIGLPRRREESDKRNAEWRKLTPQQQLAELDKRPGDSLRQRKRISASIVK